ncbi:MAG: hypothetical protein ABFS28_06800 [Bacteroidota bacterium]
MARLVTQSAELEIAPLLPDESRGVQWQRIAPGLKDFLEPHRFEQMTNLPVVPLGLRWRVTPDLGLPRNPFAVWRRDRRKGDSFDFKFSSSKIPGLQVKNRTFSLPNSPVYILNINIDNNGSGPLKVDALGIDLEPLLLQTVHVPANTSRIIRFQHPFIGGFICGGGNFQIKSVAGVSMKHFIELDDWELIEVVGLPADKGEISGYDPKKQGFPTQLKPPPDAALDRLAIAQQFYKPLVTSFPSGENLPTWDIPTPQIALEELREGIPSLLERVSKMLKAVDTHSVSSQQDFITGLTGKGIHQPEFPDQATADVDFDMPLLATFLLNSSSDPWFALTSGFGTTDFPEFIKPNGRFLEPKSYFNVSHDYMVSSIFHSHFLNTFEIIQEWCTLSHRSPLPTFGATGLGSEVHVQNRPPDRDDPYSVEIALTWLKLNRFQIQGNAIAVAENSSGGKYLNSLRSTDSGLPALFMPVKPGLTGDPILQQVNRFIHHLAQLPFSGKQHNRYGVAAMDPFARWSVWQTSQLELSPPLSQSPRLMALSLEPNMSLVNGNMVPHKLIVEITWDWQDRSPKRFQLAGVFHRRLSFPDGSKDNGHVPPEDFPSIFQTDNTLITGPMLEIIFPSDSPSGTPPDFNVFPTCSDPRVSLELLPQATNEQGQVTEGEMRRYRATISDLNLAFQGDEDWYFTIYVKGAEWRNSIVLSDSKLPLLPGRPPRLTASVPNPIPPPVPVFEPATILWSALPDAMGRSRYRLAFNPVPGATGGYAVFQAFETKLRDLADLPIRSDPDLVSRATELRDVVMPDVRSLDAFGRLNTTLIPPPPVGGLVEYEAEIPGSLEGLVAFAVMSVTKEQESSPLSTPWLLVAVPRPSVPAPPELSQGQKNGSAELSCKFPKSPFKPVKVEVMRVRREFPSRMIDTMGPAFHTSLEATWEAIDEQGRLAASDDSITHFRFSVSDQITPSWFPYYYRAVATGESSEQVGLIPGRSSQSNLVTIEQLPKHLPAMENLRGDQQNSENIRMQFEGDAPVETTPHGTFRLVIEAFDFNQGRFLDISLLDISLAKAKELPGTGSLINGELYYSSPDQDGKRKFVTLLLAKEEKYLFRIRLTDPLKRSSERMLSGKVQVNESPHLENLKVRRRGRDFTVLFESATTVQRPLFGSFMLEISLISFQGRGTSLLEKIALHRIRIGELKDLKRGRFKKILRERKIRSKRTCAYGAFFPDIVPPSPFLRRGRLRVRLTAPDGMFAVLEQNIN